jgi:hypothetical protein
MKPYVIVDEGKCLYMDWRLRGKPPEAPWPVVTSGTYEADVVVVGSKISPSPSPFTKMTLQYRITPQGTHQVCESCFEYMGPHLCLACREALCSTCRTINECEICHGT